MINQTKIYISKNKILKFYLTSVSIKYIIEQIINNLKCLQQIICYVGLHQKKMVPILVQYFPKMPFIHVCWETIIIIMYIN